MSSTANSICRPYRPFSTRPTARAPFTGVMATTPALDSIWQRRVVDRRVMARVGPSLVLATFFVRLEFDRQSERELRLASTTYCQRLQHIYRMCENRFLGFDPQPPKTFGGCYVCRRLLGQLPPVAKMEHATSGSWPIRTTGGIPVKIGQLLTDVSSSNSGPANHHY
jgi:hypothetical protein